MTSSLGSLAQSLRAVHRYYHDALTSDHTERLWRRDWDANSRPLVSALARIGSPVACLAREPMSSADDTPYVIASVDPSTGMVRFDAATAEQARGLPSAENFTYDGSPL
jgi:hypothetical protein